MRKRGTAVRIRLFAARLLILPHGMFSPSDKTDKKARPGSRFLTGLAVFYSPEKQHPRNNGGHHGGEVRNEAAGHRMSDFGDAH